jgi:Calcineurin-like phosphoesterase
MAVKEREPEVSASGGLGGIVHEVLDPAFLRDRLEQVREGGAGLLSDEDYEELFTELAEDQASPASGADPDQGEQAYLPRSAGVSILQSTLNDCILSRFDDLVKPLPKEDPSFADFALRDEGIFRKFGPCDAGWIESVLSKGLSLFRRKPRFADDPPNVALADNARIVVCGDWGTGLTGAQMVGRRMAEQVKRAQDEDREVHALHLGDVYYSGWKEQYQSLFLRYWPVRSPAEGARSWALNGNHDMYSGGHGYFGYLLRDPRFADHDGSSYFCLESTHWQLLGLDTAYENNDLAGGQADWVEEKLRSSQRKTMLLSHHQPISAFHPGKPYPFVGRLQQAFEVRQIDAWLWGHEHRCCVYEESYEPFLRFGSCIGHGGVPVLHRRGDLPAGVLWQADGFETDSGYEWQLFGFAVLDFEGPRIAVAYFDQNGNQVFATAIE